MKITPEQGQRICEQYPAMERLPQDYEAIADVFGVKSPGELEYESWTAHGVSAGERQLDPDKVQICRVNPVAYDNGQPCACPVATCNLWRGGLRPAGVGVPAYTHADVAAAHAEGYKLGLAQKDRA